MLRKALGLLERSTCAYLVATRVSHFLGQWCGKRLTRNCTAMFQVSAGALSKFTCSGRGKRRRHVETEPNCTGRVAVLQHPHSLKHKLVVVEEAIRKVDPGRVAASLDTDPWFSLGSADAPHCWHAVRLHHRWRLFAAPEAAVERVGSVMANLWQDTQHLGPAGFMTRVLLQQAHVSLTGHPRDELLLAGTVALYAQTRKKMWQKCRPKDLAQITMLHERVSKSGRWVSSLYDGCSIEETLELIQPGDLLNEISSSLDLRDSRRTALEQSLPAEVPAEIQSCWDLAITDGVVSSLPVGVSAQRRSTTNLAPSSLQERMDVWLTSAEGKEWKAARERIWATCEATT